MKVSFFKVRLHQGTNVVILNVPATADRLFELVIDSLTSEADVEVLDIHDQDKSSFDDGD